MEKLYIVLRSDLKPGLQLAQCAHAMRAFTHAHPDLDAAWFAGSNNLAVLAVPDEPALVALGERAAALGLRTAAFHEPDLEDSVTAISLEPGARRLVCRLPLALAS